MLQSRNVSAFIFNFFVYFLLSSLQFISPTSVMALPSRAAEIRPSVTAADDSSSSSSEEGDDDSDDDSEDEEEE